MTNFEKIKQMSIEDIVSLIQDAPCEHCPAHYLCRLGSDCAENIRTWLNSDDRNMLKD